ncbi:hypothetical protein FRC01_010719 [Tulasnella sp. 417]|nr:hypothetical protein FRC01_010719 [Tulasnella sp. 417]
MSKEGNQDYAKQMAKIDRRLAREMFVWQKARHSNLTPLLGFMRSTNSILLGDCPFLVSPYYKNGNMNAYLGKHPNADVLALENILINDAEEASICDFGVSRMMDELSTGFTTSNPVLTLSFAPPEILNGGKGNTTADAFSFGGLMLQLMPLLGT